MSILIILAFGQLVRMHNREQDQQVEIYRLGQSVKVLNLPVNLSGEEVLPEFGLSVTTFLSSLSDS